MVKIKEVTTGILVESTGFRETFHNRFKALMAAHAVALGEATAAGMPVTIAVPDGWGDPVVIEPYVRRSSGHAVRLDARTDHLNIRAFRGFRDLIGVSGHR